MSSDKPKKVTTPEGSAWEFKCIMCGAWGGFHLQNENFPYTPHEWAEMNKGRPPITYDGEEYSSAYPEDGKPCRGDGQHGSEAGCTGTMVWIEHGWQAERVILDETNE